jgi:hypothetical protein
MTVACEVLPPITALGARLNKTGVAILIVIFAVLETDPLCTEMFTWVYVLTAVVETVKVALVAPEGTVTVDGTAAVAGFALVSVSVMPPAGAGPPSPTVASDVRPPITILGFRVRLASDGACTPAVAVCVTPP